MEKRAILAIILSFLVLIAWAKLYSPKTVVPTKNNKIVEKQAESTPKPLKKQENNKPLLSKQAGKEKAPPKAVVKEKDIPVDTPLYKAVFSNKGPAIISFELKKYRETVDPNSPPIELFQAKDAEEDFVNFKFDNPSLLKESNITYSVSADSLTLNPNQSAKDLVFNYTYSNGTSIKQTYRFYPDRYKIDLLINIKNQSNNSVNGNIRADINNFTSKKKGGYFAFVGAALYLNNKLKDLKSSKLKKEVRYSGDIDWIAYEDGYFISAIAPAEKKDNGFSGVLMPSGLIRTTYTSPSIKIPPFNQISKKYSLFLGPKDIDILRNFGQKLDAAVYFGFFDVVAKPLNYVLNFFNGYVHNFGISIIILTILIKILFWPLTQKSQKSMKRMKTIQPLMKKLREKYKDDREQMNKELMNLYRTYKVNPMGGCLPMIIQIPVFFALYELLGSTIELRHAPFFLWINDLSAPDRLFHFAFKIPFMHPPYGIPVLTILMGASMFVTQKMQPMVGDPSQAKMMMFLPLIFTVMFINLPSGLVLYWLVQNILSIGQQYLINKQPD